MKPKRRVSATRKNARPNSRRRAAPQHRKLLPVLRPAQNMRDIIKQMILLEDHLFQPQKRCKDCIRKHFLTIEGLAEECVTLCKPRNILPESRKIAETARVFHHSWEAHPNDPRVAESLAGQIRKLRKSLMRTYAALPVNKLPTKETNAVKALLRQIRQPRRVNISPGLMMR
jgi:hypothetical protein